jgi:hypothetical protein
MKSEVTPDDILNVWRQVESDSSGYSDGIKFQTAYKISI